MLTKCYHYSQIFDTQQLHFVTKDVCFNTAFFGAENKVLTHSMRRITLVSLVVLPAVDPFRKNQLPSLDGHFEVLRSFIPNL